MRLWSRLGSLVRKLQRRGVLRAAAVYAVTAWIAVQVAAATFPALPLPPWAHTLVVVLAIFGLPVVVAVAWAYEITPEGIQRTVEEEQPPELLKARGTPWGALLLVGVVTVASAGLGWAAWETWLSPGLEAASAGSESLDDPVRGSSELPRTRLAVLPYEAGDESDSIGPVASGLAYELNSALDRVSDGTVLDVVSHWGVAPYRSSSAGLDSIARALNTGSLVTVATRSVGGGDSLEVKMELVNSRTLVPDWSGTFRSSRDSLTSLTEIVLTETVRELRRALGHELQTEEIEAETDSDAALALFYDARRRRTVGRELRREGQRQIAARAYRRADSLLVEAEELDPNWVEPTIERGWLALDRAKLPGRDVASVDPAPLREGIQHANRVLERNTDHAAALELRGALLGRLSQLPRIDSVASLRQRAIDDLQEAVATDPDRARAWAELSDVYRREARFDEAQSAARKAQKYDAFLVNEYDYLRTAIRVALDVGELERTLELTRRGQELYPDEVSWYVARLFALSAPGAPPVPAREVWSALRRVEELRGRTDPFARILVAGALARMGMADSAQAVLTRARRAVPERARAMALYYEANVRLHLGQRERAFNLLADYLASNPDQRKYVARDVYWSPVRDDSAFRALVADGG